MSLQVWLPLTKDLRNQGLSNVTITNNGATFNSAGKLGGCYQTDGSHRIAISSFPWMSMKPDYNFSLFLWVKGTTTGWLIAAGGWELLLQPTFIRIGLSGNGQYPAQLTDTFDSNTWYHLGFTWEGATGQLKLYLNGSNVATSSVPSTADFSVNNPINLTYDGPRYINDFRIYDHCLSPMEVKRISQGLILHYPLNRQGWGQENLDNFSSIANNWTMESLNGSDYSDSSYGNVIKLVTNAANQRMYHNVISTLWQNGQVYTVSFLAKADQNGRTCDMSRSIADFSPTFTLTTNWKRYSGQITSTATPGGGTLSFRIIQSGATIYITQIKLEKGEIATPYCPGSTDPDYTAMGLNSTTEYDCSGFCNNGTRTGTFNWTSNTPKYTVSTQFNGTDNAIQTPDLTTLITDKNYTIACWFYKTAIGTKSYQTIYGGPSGFELEARNGGGTDPQLVAWNWGKPIAAYEFNKWNHFVFVHSDSDCKIYLNGEYISTGTAKATNPSGNYFVGAWNASTSQNYEGLMSDFRIYATALSPTDVKSLYQNCATVDPDGTIHGQIR